MSKFSDLFNEFMKEDFCLLDEGTETKRARDAETKAKIEHLYEMSNDKYGEFNKDSASGLFDIIPYEDVTYNTHDIFIFHLNEDEAEFFKDQKLADYPFSVDDLIPKGGSASKAINDNILKLPIMPQKQAEETKARNYAQPKNCGSCTRYQGSECDDTRKLYYFVRPNSCVTNREWYTVVSRCYKLSSIVIVLTNSKQPERKEYRGKKIKDVRTLAIIDEVLDV